MAPKTYVPGAVDEAEKLYKYLTRYQATLSQSLTGDQIAAVVELLGCLATFLQKVRKPPIGP